MRNLTTTPASPDADREMRGPRPMGDLNAAMRDLDLDYAGVLALLDEGKLIGFNIAVKLGQRMTVRVLTASIQRYLHGRAREGMPWAEIFRIILPGEGVLATGLELERGLNCTQSHITNLIRAGLIESRQAARRGPGGSALVNRASVETFLQGRQIR